MSNALTEPAGVFTREQFNAWYDQQTSGRYERVDGRIHAMAAERVGHVRLKTAAHRALERAIAAAGVQCEALADGIRVETGNSDYEPDAVVNCGAPMDDDAIAARNPVIVVEVPSPGTKAVDTSLKFRGYFFHPSVSHYLIIDPQHRAVIHHQRVGAEIMSGVVIAGAIVMNPPGITIAIEDIFATR